MELLLRHSKLAWVLCGVVVVGLCAWWLMNSSRLYASAITEHEFTHIAELAQLEHEIFIEQTRHVLSVLSHVPQVRTPDSPACNTLLAAIVRDEARYANITVLNPEGKVRCSALPLAGPIDASSSAVFIRTIQARSFAVGDYIVGRISGKPVISFGYPLKDGEDVVGVVAASVKLSWLEHLAEKAKLPPKASLVLVDSSGTTLTRYPESSGVGEQAPETSYLYDKLQSAKQGLGVVELEDATGQEFLVAAVPLHRDTQEGFLHLIISLPKDSFRDYTGAVSEAFARITF